MTIPVFINHPGHSAWPSLMGRHNEYWSTLRRNGRLCVAAGLCYQYDWHTGLSR